MIDTGCKKSVDVIKNILSLLEAKHYRINCGICYCMVLGKQILYFKEKRDISKKQKSTGNCVERSSNPQCWEAQKDLGQGGILLNPCVLSKSLLCWGDSSHHPCLWTVKLISFCQIHYQVQLASSLCYFMHELRSKIGWALDSLKMSKSWTDSAKWDWNCVSNHYHTWEPQLTGGTLHWEHHETGVHVWLAGAVVWCDMAGCMILMQIVSSY